MKRKQLFTVLASLAVTALVSATAFTDRAYGMTFCDQPAQVCTEDCSFASLQLTCQEYAPEACRWHSAECWADGEPFGCNSAGYSAAICYYEEF